MRVLFLLSRCRLGVVLLALLIGCANPINQATYHRYSKMGAEAFNRGDLATAEQSYYRAVVNTRIGNLPPDDRSAAAYNLGRVKRHLCKDAEAEELLLEALGAAEKLPEPEHLPRRALELARLYYETGRFAEAAPLFQRRISLVEPRGVEESDAGPFADTLEGYALLLRKLDQGQRAAAIEERVEALRRRKNLSADPNRPRYDMRRCR